MALASARPLLRYGLAYLKSFLQQYVCMYYEVCMYYYHQIAKLRTTCYGYTCLFI